MAPSKIKKEPTRLATRYRSPYFEQDDASNNLPSVEPDTAPTTSTTAMDAEHAAIDEGHDIGTATINGEGLSANMDCFGQEGRKLITVIQRLEELNIDNTLQSLPKYIVVGDQSHGKSSIIEAVCDITLPRNEGTCTRCPFQITTTASQDNSWRCSISLSRRYIFDHSNLSQTTSGWKDTENSNHEFFDTICDKGLLDRKLRLAQVAILNPDMDVKQILHEDNPNERLSLSFSPNVIRLEITAPDLPELSFFDLPGAINVHPNMDEQHVVPFVEKLIKFYVQDKKALILLAVSGNQDPDNSTAFRFVTECRARDRCMGVITKPDLADNKQRILKVLQGETFTMGCGWFVAKQPAQFELDQGITHADARAREQEFFTTQEPWCSSDSEVASKFGTRNLQDALSRRLTDHIISELPGIKARVQEKLSQLTSQLDQFPEQAKAPCQTVSREVDELKTLITKHIEGYGTYKNFRNELSKALRQLYQTIKEGRPDVKLSTPGFEQPSISVESDDEDDQMLVDQTPNKRKRPNGSVNGTTSKKSACTPRKNRHGAVTEAPSHEIPKIIYELDALKDIYDKGLISGFPSNIDPLVTKSECIKPLNSWREQIQSTLGVVNDITRNLLLGVLASALAPRRQTKLYTEITTSLKEHLRELMDDIGVRVEHMMTCELHKPISYDPSVQDRKNAIQEDLLNRRKETRINEHFDTIDAGTNKPTPSNERKKKAADEGLLGFDPYQREIKWIAQTLVYYDTACTRVADNVTLILEHDFLYMLEKKLKERLETDLHVTDGEYCAQLLAEDPERERLRRRLIDEREKLLQAMKELEGLPNLR